MDVLTSTLSIITDWALPFLGVLTIIVFVHEMGHFLVGRWCGTGITAFSIGFGPELFGWNDKKGTRWKFCAIPLGGYVKFVDDENVASLPTGKERGDLPANGLQSRPLWARAAIVAAGPFANFIFAIFVLAGLFMTAGHLIVTPRIVTVVEGSPAAAAGLQPGDYIRSIDGIEVESFTDVRRLVGMKANEQVELVYERDGQRVSTNIVPEEKVIRTQFGTDEPVGVIGVTSDINQDTTYVKTFSLFPALYEAVKETWFIITQTLEFVGKIFTGTANVDQLGGPVKIAQITNQAAEAADTSGLAPIIQLMAILSISIGLINLFPIPLLDGGHLMFYALEAVRGKPLPPKIQEYAATIGFTMIMSLMLFTFWNDLT